MALAYDYATETEYLDDVLNKVVNIDCIEMMRSLPSGCAQFVFADPPFNLNKKYLTYNDNRDFDEYLKWTEQWIEAALDVLRDDGTLMVYNIPRLLTYTATILNEKAEFRHWIAWNSGGKPLGRTLQPAHYGILFYTKTRASKFRDVRAPHKSCRKCNTYLKDYGGKEYQRHPFGYQISDVWDDIHRVRHASKRIDNHPCQLPVHLIERLILMTTDPGDLVIDPFCGGGSAAVAAKQLGRDYIGAEIDTHYQQVSQQKFDAARPTKAGDAFASFHLGNIVSIQDGDVERGLLWNRLVS